MARSEMEKGENIQSRGGLVHFQLSRVTLRDTLDSRDTRSFRLLHGPSKTRSRHRFPHVAILAFKSSDLFVVYLFTLSTIHVSVVRRRDDGDDSPRWTQFGRYSVSLSLPLNLFIRSPTRVRSINVYNAARSPSLFMPLESLYDWKKLMDYKLIKADQEGTEFSTDNGGDFFDLLHWFRRARVDLPGSWTRGSPFTHFWLVSWSSNFFFINDNCPRCSCILLSTFHILWS